MKKFLKDWGGFIAFLLILVLSYCFIWLNVSVDGHSMDPTLADGERLFVLRTAKIDRFDIVVAKENDQETGKEKLIVKRVIGTPGDTITFNNDTLTVNGKTVDEPYLDEYKALFAKDKLQETYSYNKIFKDLAANSVAFTTDTNGSATFSVTVPEGQYYLLGDDRIVSQDSRSVGTFGKDSIIGEVKFRFWPFSRIGTLN